MGNNSRQPIQKSAKLITQEITQYLDENFDIEDIWRISFISHSLGGIVARAVVSRLKRFQNKFYAFCSLASPHLGAKHQKSVVKIGMWFMKIFKGADSINQLELTDSEDIEGRNILLLLTIKEFRHFY